MNTVKVKREELLTKVRANRDAHRSLFLKAQEGYRKLVIEELDRMLADAKAVRPIARSINLVEPADHTEDYDRVLAMLEMSVDDAVILSAEEFSQYVLAAGSGAGSQLPLTQDTRTVVLSPGRHIVMMKRIINTSYASE